MQQTPIANLWLLTAGMKPSNPAETLASTTFDQLLAEARREFDIVLVDTPPLMVVSDPCIVATRTDGLLLVVRTNKNSRAVVRQTGNLLAQQGVNVLGVITNAVEHEDLSRYGYGYSNGYSDYLQQEQPSLERAFIPHAVRSDASLS